MLEGQDHDEDKYVGDQDHDKDKYAGDKDHDEDSEVVFNDDKDQDDDDEDEQQELDPVDPETIMIDEQGRKWREILHNVSIREADDYFKNLGMEID